MSTMGQTGAALPSRSAPDFSKRHAKAWDRFADLLRKVERRNLAALSYNEIKELSYLYRSVAADLASASGHFPHSQLHDQLNQLLGRAHSFLYQPPKPAPVSILHFYAVEFPRVFRKNLKYFLFATALSLAAAAFAYTYAIMYPKAVQDKYPEIQVHIERKQMWTRGIIRVSPEASSAIATNNISVTFVTFAGGATFGVLTLFELILNGMMLGFIIGLIQKGHFMLPFFSFVTGHGVIELSAIFMAGGAGLMLPDAFLNCGELPRLESLKRKGLEAVKIILGTVPVLLIAATVEGFISPDESLPSWFRIGLGLTLGILLYAYLFLSARASNKDSSLAKPQRD
ncbi:MAG: stage II sporulation protein M [bacterium]